jgi:hypothetical protein
VNNLSAVIQREDWQKVVHSHPRLINKVVNEIASRKE